MKLLILILFSLTAFSAGLVQSAQAQNFTADKKQSLTNLDAFLLVVEFAQDAVELDGLSRTELEIEIAQRLRRSGIRLMGEVEWSRQPGVPYLYVNLITVRSELGFYSYRIEVKFNQEVQPVRNSGITSMATTWESGLLGLIGVRRIGAIKPEILSLVDEFIQDFQSANFN